jgi:hypothetical protein
MFTRALPQVAGVEAANFSQPLPSALEPEVKTHLTLKGLLPPLESATAKKLSLKSKNSNKCFFFFFFFFNSFATIFKYLCFLLFLRVIENGVETITITENGVLKTKTVNGVPQAIGF